jgi:ATP phosphoribosyltransferase
MKKELKVAIPKGYLFEPCIKILMEAGYSTAPLKDRGRKLIIRSEKDSIQYIISRPMDIPVYVEYGACDIGFSGKDYLVEKESNVYELLDLKCGKCRLILATLKNEVEKVKDHYRQFGSIKIATSYPKIAKKYFDQKGIQAEIIKLYGSVELAPVLGIADEILDLTSTGRTLKEHDLVEMEEIFESTVRVIANITSYRIRYDEISGFIKKIKKVIK